MIYPAFIFFRLSIGNSYILTLILNHLIIELTLLYLVLYLRLEEYLYLATVTHQNQTGTNRSRLHEAFSLQLKRKEKV